jgi:predicted metal-dependent phosphoesterase TrpH
MDGKVDLHMHTTHSDGFYSTSEIVNKAKQKGLDAISITDHDSTNAIEEATVLGKELGIEVIPGVEISSEHNGKEVHILGYFFDHTNKEFARYLSFFREERVKRAERIVKKLESLGLHLTFDDIISVSKNSAIGRPHIAQAMVKRGLVSSYYEAFNKYIGNGCPAYEKKVHLSPESAYKIITDAGGLSFIAHPGFMQEDMLKELIESGVDGIEVYHPSHPPQKIKFYKGIVSEYYLLESGGSDYHGGQKNDDANFGKYYTTIAALDAMKKHLARSTA